MRVAFVNHSPIRLPKGDRPLDSISIGIWCYEMATRLSRNGGWEAVVYHQDRSLLDSNEELHRGVVFKSFPVGLDERVHRQLTRLRRWAGIVRLPDPKMPLFGSNWFHPSYIRGVAKDIRARDCDVVHISNFSQFVPVIRRAQPRAKIVLHMQCEWLIQLDEKTIARRLQHCDLISGCSRFITDGIRERFPQHADKCFTLYNGVNLESFSPGERDAGGEREILYVGRFSPEKGLHVLLEAFADVAKRVPGIKLRMIGGSVPAPYEFIVAISDDPLVERLGSFYLGPEPYARALQSHLAPELRDRVSFEDPLPQADLASAYRNAEVFVFPSVWHEPFGMPVIEAMAFGIPVISTRGGGIPEFMPDGEAGLLVDRGDSRQLADALCELLNDGDRRARMGRTGRARIEAEFSWDHIADQLDSRLRGTVSTVPN